jgi:hypothetical protein
MICNCQHCHHSFWRYRRDHPPKSFCSVPCFNAGPVARKSAAAELVVPPRPETVLADFRSHRLLAHACSNILSWVPDCSLCNEFEADYAASLEYWFSAYTAELAGDRAALLRASTQLTIPNWEN